MPYSIVSPGYVRVPIAASDMQRCPASLISLVNVRTVFDQQLYTVQVSREHSFMQSSQAWAGWEDRVKAVTLCIEFPLPLYRQTSLATRTHLRGG